MTIKKELDNLVEKYETKDFIKDDPIQFPHRFKNSEDIEISGFIASCFAYGNRKIFIKKLDELFEIMQNEPKNFIENFDKTLLKGFCYRFANDEDIISILEILGKLYLTGGGLKTLFESAFDNDIYKMLETVTVYFYERANLTRGFCHMIPDARKNGAMKRMNMFLRWMVRKSAVDFGIWDFIPSSKLLIPLDVHVARISREKGLLTRKSNDKKAVLELSKKLQEFDKNDPIKYDFALFGFGVNN